MTAPLRKGEKKKTNHLHCSLKHESLTAPLRKGEKEKLTTTSKKAKNKGENILSDGWQAATRWRPKRKQNSCHLGPRWQLGVLLSAWSRTRNFNKMFLSMLFACVLELRKNKGERRREEREQERGGERRREERREELDTVA